MTQTTTQLSPLEKWRESFDRHPFEALDRLLLGRAYMGRLNRNDADEILFRLFHNANKDRQAALDRAMCEWLAHYWEKAPASVSASRWSEILRDAFSTLIRLNLSEAQKWPRAHYSRGRQWLRRLYLGPARDPEADFLRALALCQQDQTLLPRWMLLCRLEEDRPLHFAGLGLLGLCKLPEANGEPPGDLPPAVFGGIIAMANNIARRFGNNRKGQEFWRTKVLGLMARYPRSTQYWTQHFWPLLYTEPNSAAAAWLGKLIPRLKKELEGNARSKARPVLPPPRAEREDILDKLRNRPVGKIRSEMKTFLTKHRQYAYQTGHADFLVKTFSNIGYKILRQDPQWALALVKEAFLWAPHNPILWTERAKIETYLGRYDHAQGLLWEAKRRFPEEPRIRNILAELLRRQGKTDIAAIVCRQALEDFPDDIFCRNGLAEVLKAQGKLPEAEEVYRETKEAFPDDVVCRTGLAEVLKAREKFDEAEAVYRETTEAFPDDVVCRNGLAEVLKAREKFDDAEAVYRETKEAFPDNIVCRTGLAVIWLLQGKRQDALRLLEETARTFNDEVARGLLRKLTGGEHEVGEAVIAEYDQLSTALTEATQASASDETAIATEKKAVTVESPEPTAAGPSSQPEVATPDLGQDQPEIEAASANVEHSLSDDSSFESEIKIAGNLGPANLYRLAARRTQGEDKERYQREFVQACKQAFAADENNVNVLLEQGLGKLDESPEQAESFFAQQIQKNKQSHVLGFQVGYLRAKSRQLHEVTSAHWQELAEAFPHHETLIALENARVELRHANGTTLPALEKLRKKMQPPLELLPGALRNNEKWLRATVARRLFGGNDITHPLTREALPSLRENYARHDLVLQGVAEQCFAGF